MNRTELSLSDEWETPKELYDHLCGKYGIKPKLDVCATQENRKCYSAIFSNSLEYDWTLPKVGNIKHLLVDVWCNPPHSDIGRFVVKAFGEWRRHNITIMMIIPANSMCTNYAEECIEGKAEYHPINRKWCKFLYKGEEKDHARNGYFVVIWRKK